jgi:3-oxoacyl-(acyl-carrier-protein) synthase
MTGSTLFSDRQVVVTGVGVVTPLGHDLATTLSRLKRGDTGIGPVTAFDASHFADMRAAEVKGFEPRVHFRAPKSIKLTDRVARFAVAAGRMALADAGYPRTPEALEGVGVVIGSSGSDLQAKDLAAALGPDAVSRAIDHIPFFADRILSGLNPLWLLINLPNMASAHVAIQLGARGPNSTVMTDWIAGSQALAEACDWIRTGETQAVLAGGADSGVYPFAFGSYEQEGLLGNGRTAMGTTGFVPGEGAGILLVEEAAHARARGARVYGEIVAHAAASGPPGSDDQADRALNRTLEQVLRDAGWRTEDVRAISPASVFAQPFCGDERDALGAVLGAAGAAIPRVGYRSQLGHALAAAGPIDLALLLADDDRIAGPTICNALGFSGQAASLAVIVDRHDNHG